MSDRLDEGNTTLTTKPTEELRIPVIEESVDIGVRAKTTGSVRVRTSVDHEQLTLQQDLRETRVVVERVPIDQRVDRAPQERAEGATRILPVLEERIVIVKELWLVEELHIRSEEVIETVDIPVERRVSRVEVERTNPQQEI